MWPDKHYFEKEMSGCQRKDLLNVLILSILIVKTSREPFNLLRNIYFVVTIMKKHFHFYNKDCFLRNANSVLLRYFFSDFHVIGILKLPILKNLGMSLNPTVISPILAISLNV